MTWRTDLNKAQRATYKAQRLMRDGYVVTGPNGIPRLTKRVARRLITRKLGNVVRRSW